MATTTVPPKKVNRIGLEPAAYKGNKSTLCAGCGHNAISERIVEAFYELGVRPHQVVKLSGIGCSSKTPAYFLRSAHGFNAVHGRMPSIATGTLLANHKLTAIGVSGDGDTASIGIGQFVHLMRRNLPLVYVIEDNGCYGLTKGQFSATADRGSVLKNGVVNDLPPIDTCALAIQLGATYVGRSFSGDKKQLMAMLQGAISHHGTAMLDVISPCVTFNDHEGSTKSYLYTRQHDFKAVEADFVPPASEILAHIGRNGAVSVTMHDGSAVLFKGVPPDYDPTDREKVYAYLEEHHGQGEVVTGLLYVDESVPDLHEMNATPDLPLTGLPYEKLCPGSAKLDKLQEAFR